jgi:hypothetical protein
VVAEYVFSRLLQDMVGESADDNLIKALAARTAAFMPADHGLKQRDIEDLIRVGLG